MLTDIFAYRYLDHPIWQSVSEVEQRLLNQALGIVKEFFPADESGLEKWKLLHDQLARELGVDELSKRYYSYTNSTTNLLVQGFFSWAYVCEQFVKAPFPPNHLEPDRFVKERISFIELAFRFRGDELAKLNAKLPSALLDAKRRDLIPALSTRIPGSAVTGVKAWNESQNNTFAKQVDELNERFRRARAPLSYHNGFIQVSADELIERQISKPFWDAVADPQWQNVDIDIKEAIDRRDSNDKDPALFAARALESAIKIVSDSKGWTRGNEAGASNYIDNLVSKKNGSYLATWEADMLRDYFRKVRNTLVHGPGSDPMPVLSIPQTDWAIETAMSWVRTLVRRM